MRQYTGPLLELVAGRFKVLSEPMRLRILNSLRSGERTVTELVDEIDAGQANVSKHLNLLYRSRMVERRKEGLNVYYRIADPAVFELCEMICQSLEDETEARQRALNGSWP